MNKRTRNDGTSPGKPEMKKLLKTPKIKPPKQKPKVEEKDKPK